MTEYDYSEEGYHRFMETQNRIARWVERTEQCHAQFKSPFGPRSDLGDDDIPFIHGHHPHQYMSQPQNIPTVLPDESASQVAARQQYHHHHHHSSRRSRHSHSHHQQPAYVVYPPQPQYEYPGSYSVPPFPGQSSQYMSYSPPPSPYEYPTSPMGYPPMSAQYSQGQPGYVIMPRKKGKFKVMRLPPPGYF